MEGPDAWLVPRMLSTETGPAGLSSCGNPLNPQRHSSSETAAPAPEVTVASDAAGSAPRILSFFIFNVLFY